MTKLSSGTEKAAFDPWTASEEEAVEETLSHSLNNRRMPISQFLAAQRVTRMKGKIEAGDRGAILDAVAACALEDLVMPLWLAKVFLSAYRQVRHYRARSWDAVFGPAHKPGINLAAMERRRSLGPRIVEAVWNERLGVHRRPINDILFDEVGDRFGVSKTVCSEIYYQHKYLWHWRVPKDE